MKCPACAGKTLIRQEEYVDQYDAWRQWECIRCKTAWKQYGEPVLEVISVKWEKDIHDDAIEYGPDVDVDGLKVAEIMRAAEALTVPMFDLETA